MQWIFDIDGCIMPSMFPNIEEGEKQSPEDNENIVKRINNEGRHVRIWQEFFDFYLHHCKPREERIYFVTGRKRSHFGALTNVQLFPIDYTDIIFYPEVLNHTEYIYHKWKYNAILGLIEFSKPAFIFDDDTGYFDALKFHPNVILNHIDNRQGWATADKYFRLIKSGE